MAFCNPCMRPADSSMLAFHKHPSKSLKTLLRRQLCKKSCAVNKCQTPIRRPIQKQQSSRKFQRIKGSNLIREVIYERNQTMDQISNYDMTVFHDDELDDTEVALSHRESKKVPCWARKSQLQLAIINQIYYNDKNPEDIFGAVHLDRVREMVDSIELWNTELPMICSYSNMPANFV
ncbi:unnamed protein product [Adineta ricciae]|uniref:Inner centromere protein ARK-binding domain-containing protein n=1 Tax=Adineta ricciae TaxID=249248 RepID=A0A813Q271_ADIRI|nr:unnamed protein product [Adineta ricciae]